MIASESKRSKSSKNREAGGKLVLLERGKGLTFVKFNFTTVTTFFTSVCQRVYSFLQYVFSWFVELENSDMEVAGIVAKFENRR